MENLTAVDGGAALIVIVSAILAFSRGLVRELMAILGWIGAAVAAYYFAPSVQPLVKELPVVGEFLSESCELSVVAAGLGVFVIGLIVAALFTPLFSGAVQRSALGGIDQALGFLFGAARGVLAPQSAAGPRLPPASAVFTHAPDTHAAEPPYERDRTRV